MRYLYLLDFSHAAIQTGYLQVFAEQLLENLENIINKHDKRLQIGFIGFDQYLHFFEMNIGNVYSKFNLFKAQ